MRARPEASLDLNEVRYQCNNMSAVECMYTVLNAERIPADVYRTGRTLSSLKLLRVCVSACLFESVMGLFNTSCVDHTYFLHRPHLLALLYAGELLKQPNRSGPTRNHQSHTYGQFFLCNYHPAAFSPEICLRGVHNEIHTTEKPCEVLLSLVVTPCAHARSGVKVLSVSLSVCQSVISLKNIEISQCTLLNNC